MDRTAPLPARLASFGLALLALSVGFSSSAAAADLGALFSGDFAIPADATTLPSGVVTTVLVEGEGDLRPDGDDMVSLQVIGRDAAGHVFQDTYPQERPLVLLLGQAFPAFREAVQLMNGGETRRVWIPAELSPDQPGTPSGAVVLDLELLGIQSLPSPPAELSRPQNADRTPFGTYTRRVSEGEGTEHPVENAAALVHYIGWDSTGRVFDASYTRFRPTLMPLAKVMPPLSDCVRRMVEGEERLCWIPANVAEGGNWPGAPRGKDIVFHLELLKIGDGSVFEKVGDAAEAAAPQMDAASGDQG